MGDVHQLHQDEGLPWREALKGIELKDVEMINADALDGDEHQEGRGRRLR